MQHRTIGNLGVSALGLGCMPMVGRGSVHYGEADPAESLATLRRALDLGVTFFDTAEVYGPFVNEELLGRAVAGRRDEVAIATKFAFRFEADGSYRLDSSPDTVKRACEGSLRRLGVEAIDLYDQHRLDPGTPSEDTMGALADLVRAGKVRNVGLCEVSADTLRRAHAVHPVAAVQSEYSPWERGLEGGLMPAARALGVGIVPYSPFGQGFLAGRVASRDDLSPTDYRRRDPRYADDAIGANLAIVDAVKDVAGKHGVSAAQVALAWLLAQGDDVVPIPGCKRRATLEDSMGAADLRLSADDLGRLDRAAPRGGTAGPRYGEAEMRSIDRGGAL